MEVHKFYKVEVEAHMSTSSFVCMYSHLIFIEYNKPEIYGRHWWIFDLVGRRVRVRDRERTMQVTHWFSLCAVLYSALLSPQNLIIFFMTSLILWSIFESLMMLHTCCIYFCGRPSTICIFCWLCFGYCELPFTTNDMRCHKPNSNSSHF